MTSLQARPVSPDCTWTLYTDGTASAQAAANTSKSPYGLLWRGHRMATCLNDAGRLRRWWGEERMHVAAAVRTADGDEILLTHAGLTVDAWRRLGEPMTATTAALLLNERPEPLIWLCHGFTTDTTYGPLWAEAGPELYEPWMS